MSILKNINNIHKYLSINLLAIYALICPVWLIIEYLKSGTENLSYVLLVSVLLYFSPKILISIWIFFSCIIFFEYKHGPIVKNKILSENIILKLLRYVGILLYILYTCFAISALLQN